MRQRAEKGRGSISRTYTGRARCGDGTSRFLRIVRPAGETREPTRATVMVALARLLRDGETLDGGTVSGAAWQARGTATDGRRVTVYGATRQEAADKLAAATKRAAAGVTADDARLTLGRFLTERWLPTLDGHVAPATWVAYESHVRVHLFPRLGRVKLNALTASQVDRMLADVRAGGASPATANRVRATLRRALGQAARWKLTPENVARDTTHFKEDTPRVVPYSAGQAYAFLNATRGHRLYAVWAVALGTGMRQGECLGMQWADLDLDAGRYTLRQALRLRRGQRHEAARVPTLAKPKTGLSRPVRVRGFAIDALRRQRAAQNRERAAYNGVWPGGDFVFTTTVGTPLDGPTVTKALQREMVAAGLPRQRFHDFRHAAGSIALAEGASLRAVQEMLGHKSIATTANIYAHVYEAELDATTAAVDAAIRRYGDL